MICGGRWAGIDGVASLGLVLLVTVAAIVPGAAMAQDEPVEEPASPAPAPPPPAPPDRAAADAAAEAGESQQEDGGATTAAADKATDKATDNGGRQVVIGRHPKTAAQSCQSRWQTCSDQVQKNFDSMWHAHRKRREACDRALREFEQACEHRGELRPKRCKRRAQSDWRKCDSIANRTHLRELKQIQRQRRACAQVYRICVGI